jgi:hypothetical protein
MADTLAECQAELAAKTAELEQAESALAELEARFSSLSSTHEAVALDKARLRASNEHLGTCSSVCGRLKLRAVAI